MSLTGGYVMEWINETAQEIREKYHNPVSDVQQRKRSSYYCPKCCTYFLYHRDESPPEFCQFKINDDSLPCGEKLIRKAFPYSENLGSFENKSATKCCECDSFTDRKINGIYICLDCYPEYRQPSSIDALGESILNCAIDFNPELRICKGSKTLKLPPCIHFRDCCIHYVFIDDSQKTLDVEK